MPIHGQRLLDRTYRGTALGHVMPLLLMDDPSFNSLVKTHVLLVKDQSVPIFRVVELQKVKV